ncbi:UNVERIFIED_CONTAM: Retrovirus-related Pol polyprotein from transposon TNT 1-94 [Sesamum angustifolium]|uniref:Retrovirus-related Pol polyprotein from transposon TNT 1-94 n=1 Tax=Sesamum angustifolium TaxID=2727405 RepID=A0AAW2RKL6_9LAMI
MKSHDVAFWKEAVNDEMDSIMGNNTWVLVDLPPGCKPLGCKWIFEKNMKVDGTIEKFKARLVIQGFRQRPGIDYFDIYAPVARISTIRLLIALASIHNLVCKLVKSLYGLKQAPKQWHQKFYEVVLSSGYRLNQSDKCVYSKFDNFGNGVIICLYVDHMLIFGRNQQQVDLTKEFLSSRFSMKDMREADVILGIRIIRENKGISISQSHYIEKLEYSKVIGCLMYAMSSTRPDIAYAVGKLSRFTSNPNTHHSQKITLTSGWVFLPRGGAISWVSKKQSCITNSTMESEFVALAAAGKEAEWLRNLIHEIPL